jgi:RNA polymerase sigma-70 factor (ECF subfamily)
LEAAPDGHLVAAALRGDETAHVVLFRRHAGRLMATLRVGFHLTAAEAEDVMQETFIRAFENLGQLGHPDRFGLWIQAIARREALASARRGARRLERDGAAAAEASNVVELVVGEEPAHRVVRALFDELADGRERAIIQRFYVDGDCSVQQLADELGVAKGTVTSRLTRFRARIKRRLAALLAAEEAGPKGASR